ncbi:MafI family immunity protein [Streptomyces sp. IPPR8]|uniref:MafI family immunity protein n=1 Tax=Streptomyces sp. IPPR8 TaxID=3417301 RepID=UPI003D69C2CB
MTHDREALQASWNQTRDHLDAARAHLTRLPDIDLSATLSLLEHNELGLAFDCLVDLGDDLDLPLSFWQHLDRAAREMRLFRRVTEEPASPAARSAQATRAASWPKTSSNGWARWLLTR